MQRAGCVVRRGAAKSLSFGDSLRLAAGGAKGSKVRVAPALLASRCFVRGRADRSAPRCYGCGKPARNAAAPNQTRVRARSWLQARCGGCRYLQTCAIVTADTPLPPAVPLSSPKVIFLAKSGASTRRCAGLGGSRFCTRISYLRRVSSCAVRCAAIGLRSARGLKFGRDAMRSFAAGDQIQRRLRAEPDFRLSAARRLRRARRRSSAARLLVAPFLRRLQEPGSPRSFRPTNAASIRSTTRA